MRTYYGVLNPYNRVAWSYSHVMSSSRLSSFGVIVWNTDSETDSGM